MASSDLPRNEIEALYRPIPSMDLPIARYPGFRPGTSEVIAKGTIRGPGHRPVPCDILWERDVEVVLSDGTRIYTDLFRPHGNDAALPTIISWSPYGKLSGSQSVAQIPFNAGIPKSATTGWESFEAPDPGYWCAHGYAVATPDVRGTFMSEGDYDFWSDRAAQDGYDFVEWVAAQAWSDGKIAFSGNSQLSILQWFIAAKRPPHLTAIAPWEALIDMYRNDTFNGGVKDAKFNDSIIKETYGRNRIEDIPAMADRYPLMNSYWESKIAKVERIDVPAYVVASWTNPVHSRGTLWAWQRLTTAKRWLRIHNQMEWPDYYRKESVEDLRRFFDHFLKGVDNGWETTPRVRYSVLDPGGTDTVNRPAQDFPLPETRYEKLFLDPGTGRLDWAKPAQETSVSYPGDDNTSEVEFLYRFDRETELVGPLSLKLWVEVEGHDDADLHFWVQKLDRGGHQVGHSVLPMPWIVDRGIKLIRRVPLLRRLIPWRVLYTGPWGKQKASLRKLDKHLSSPGQPIHAFDEYQRLEPGEIVPVDVLLWPISLRFRAGEMLRLRIAGYNMRGPFLPHVSLPDNENRGQHRLHGGGKYDSHILLPIHSQR